MKGRVKFRRDARPASCSVPWDSCHGGVRRTVRSGQTELGPGAQKNFLEEECISSVLKNR